MANEEYLADRCVVRIRVYLSVDGRIGRIDGPITEGENGFREERKRPDDSFKLVMVYEATGTFVPYFPAKLPGQVGVDRWLDSLKAAGFHLDKLL